MKALDYILLLVGGFIILAGNIYVIMQGLPEQFLITHALLNLLAGITLIVAYVMKHG